MNTVPQNCAFSDLAKWIWVDTAQTDDSYGEFYTEFSVGNEPVTMKISADSNYAVFVNDRFVESGQYCDFPYHKVYDEFDLTPYCKEGKNKLAILVWYYGESCSNCFTYYPGKAGLLFEVSTKDGVLVASNELVLSRISPAYRNGACKYITGMLGFTFAYDCTAEDDWKSGALTNFAKSRVVDQKLDMYPRPIKKLKVCAPVQSKKITQGEGYAIYDLGREEAGYLCLRVNSSKKQTLTIYYGEHLIEDGTVPGIIASRQFNMEITVGEGVSEYTNYFRRLGGRYLQINYTEDIEVDFLTVLPTEYPLNVVQRHFDDPLMQKIYDVSVRTLHLCMHEHYEDTPWREQSFYAMDSRNQMLCGYYAFEEYEFVRASLYLMSQDNRDDDFLSICAPTKCDLIIPSFALHYFTAVYEYCVYSKDLSLAKEILPKLESVMAAFLRHVKNDVFENPIGKSYWNFYEWVGGLDGAGYRTATETTKDAAGNCLLSIALQRLQDICDLLGEKRDYSSIVQKLNESIRRNFYVEQTGLYRASDRDETAFELVNAFAILCGAATKSQAEFICEAFAKNSIQRKTTLSMVCFKYDAMLQTDKEKYRAHILAEIEKKYKRMLDEGATSFWETERGWHDFDRSGSMCHGWSALPVYYYNTLLES